MVHTTKITTLAMYVDMFKKKKNISMLQRYIKEPITLRHKISSMAASSSPAPIVDPNRFLTSGHIMFQHKLKNLIVIGIT